LPRNVLRGVSRNQLAEEIVDDAGAHGLHRLGRTRLG
jgi:hypothetical protein